VIALTYGDDSNSMVLGSPHGVLTSWSTDDLTEAVVAVQDLEGTTSTKRSIRRLRVHDSGSQPSTYRRSL